MREIITKYDGICRKCEREISAGEPVVYEKRVGIFCPACAPTDTEEIRSYRQGGADRKADRLEEWAGKRREKARPTQELRERYRGDHAFNTQPGHIPERVRLIRREERMFEDLDKAREFEGRASRLRAGVRVAGDAEAAKQAKREAVRAKLGPGDRVFSFLYGESIVRKVNKKTATIQTERGATFPLDLSFLKLIEKAG